jgi:hypothetical protein
LARRIVGWFSFKTVSDRPKMDDFIANKNFLKITIASSIPPSPFGERGYNKIDVFKGNKNVSL